MASTVPSSNGKRQPWVKAWPPGKDDLAGVVEKEGQMLLLDGTGGSGTTAVPNAVTLPPKPKENTSSQSNGTDKVTTEGKTVEQERDQRKE
jgi:hypothetical protein